MNDTNKLLESFEHLKPIEVSDEWRDALEQRLSRSNKTSVRRISNIQYAAVAVFFLTLNAVFVFSVLKKQNAPQNLERTAALKTISQTLLINPSSINN